MHAILNANVLAVISMFQILMQKNKKLALILAPLILIVVYAVVYYGFKSFEVSQEGIEEFLEPFGPYSLIAAYFAQLAISLTPIPDSVVMLPVLIIFGPIEGSIIVISGVQTAAIVHYFVARRLGKKYVYKKFPQTKNYTEQFSKHTTVEELTLMRVFSFLSFDVVAFMSGLANIRFRRFIFATTLALFPIVLPNALITYGLFTDRPQTLALIWAITIIIVVLLAYFAGKSPLSTTNRESKEK